MGTQKAFPVKPSNRAPSRFRRRSRAGFALAAAWLAAICCAPATRAGGRLIIEAAGAGASTIELVRRDQPWRFRKGLTPPPADWLLLPEAELGEEWLLGPGGFGYGDPGIQGEATGLEDMRGAYTTLCLRRAFDIAEPLSPRSHLFLRVDFDDGFVAWLDGAEIVRANAPGEPGAPVPYNATAPSSHEASCCDGGAREPSVWDLGPAAELLAPGAHILALEGLNASRQSSDFHLIADLYAADPRPLVEPKPLFVIARTNRARLFGAVQVPGAASLRLNGKPLAWTPGATNWEAAIEPTPGWNRFRIEALDANGLALAAAWRDLLNAQGEEPAELDAGAETVWGGPGRTLRVDGAVRVPAGARLLIASGTTVLFAPEAKIAIEGGALRIEGAPEAPVILAPAEGEGAWGGIEARGADASFEGSGFELIGAPVVVADGARLAIEEAAIRDFPQQGQPILHVSGGADASLRRCYLARYYETLWQRSLVRIEECLFEDFSFPNSDGVDFDEARPGSLIRRCTIRRGLETNTDAIDIGSRSEGVTVESCLLEDVADKGVSIGEESSAIVITNCLVARAGIGAEVKDSSSASLFASTIADCQIGLRLRIKTGSHGGRLTEGWNNIVARGGAALELLDDSTLALDHSCLEGAEQAGTGNLSLAPAFRAPEAGDYQLAAGSPLLRAGRDGAALGPAWPVGAPFAASPPQLGWSVDQGAPELVIPVGTHRPLELLQAPAIKGASWRTIRRFFPGPLPETRAIRPSLADKRGFFRLRRLPETAEAP